MFRRLTISFACAWLDDPSRRKRKLTVGDPKSDLNEMALGGLLLKSGVGLAEKLGVKADPKAGSALQGLGNLLTGQQPAANTNQPSTHRPRHQSISPAQPTRSLQKIIAGTGTDPRSVEGSTREQARDRVCPPKTDD